MVCQLLFREDAKRQKVMHVGKCKAWHLKEDDITIKVRDVVQARSNTTVSVGNRVQDIWKEFKDCL